MKITKRQQKILEYLIQVDGFITAKNISELFQISEKTVYRDIKRIGEVYKDAIVQTSGKGYQINYQAYIQYSQSLEKDKIRGGMSTFERRLDILISMLSQSPKETSINKLAEYYYVSPNSIVNDLKKIEEKLQGTLISLNRTSSGTYLEGSEKDIRNLLMDSFHNLIDDDDFNITMIEKIGEESIDFLQEQFDYEDIKLIKQLLDSAEERLGFTIEAPYYINVFTHLLILIKRCREGQVEKEEIFLQEETIIPTIFQIAKMILNHIENYLNMTLMKNELYYIYCFLISSRNSKVLKKSEAKTFQNTIYMDFVENVIEEMSSQLGNDFSRNLKLKNSLLLHVKPMIKRSRYNIKIRNPLLYQIKSELVQVFEPLKVILSKLYETYGLNEISEDEISYITLYFQAELENIRKQMRVVVVCNTGVGTSQLLTARFKKAFPDGEIIDVVSLKRVWEYKDRSDVDLILTTVKLEGIPIPTVLVSPLLNKRDIENITAII